MKNSNSETVSGCIKIAFETDWYFKTGYMIRYVCLLFYTLRKDEQTRENNRSTVLVEWNLGMGVFLFSEEILGDGEANKEDRNTLNLNEHSLST